MIKISLLGIIIGSMPLGGCWTIAILHFLEGRPESAISSIIYGAVNIPFIWLNYVLYKENQEEIKEEELLK